MSCCAPEAFHCLLSLSLSPKPIVKDDCRTQVWQLDFVHHCMCKTLGKTDYTFVTQLKYGPLQTKDALLADVVLNPEGQDSLWGRNMDVLMSIPESICKAGSEQCHLLSQGCSKGMKAEDLTIIFSPFLWWLTALSSTMRRGSAVGRKCLVNYG